MRDVYLITGASSFIGANLARKLVANNNRVAIISRSKKLSWRLESLRGSIGVYECNLLDKKLSTIVKKIQPEYIFHLAESGENQQADAKSIYETNCLGTVNLVEAIKQNKFKLFVNCGSFSEGLEDSHFAISKSAATSYCTLEAKTFKLPIITIRRPTAYGYYDWHNSPISTYLISRITKKNPPVINGLYSRDVLHVDDLVDAYIQCTVQNVENGAQLDMFGNELADDKAIKEIVKKWESKKGLPHGWDANYKFKSVLRMKKLGNQILKWEPSNNLSQGLTLYYEWLQENKKHYLP